MVADGFTLELNDTMKQAMAVGVIKWLQEQGALDKALQAAFQYLLDPAQDGYGRKRENSRIVESFQQQAEKVASMIAYKTLAEDEVFQAKVRDAMKERLAELMADDTEFNMVMHAAVAKSWHNKYEGR